MKLFIGQRPIKSLSRNYKKEKQMNDYRLLIDLHKNGDRQGPGGDAETEKALLLSMADRSAPLKIADIGCGTGASTPFLARNGNSKEAREVVEAKKQEFELYEKYKAHYSYGVYIARKTGQTDPY